ncbi:MAG: zinc-ribbon domain-containing protein [Candidatus Thorarchaeota archaeon]
MPICPECYSQVEEGAKFCRSCGARMPGIAAKAAPPPTPPQYARPAPPSPHVSPYRSEEGLKADQALVLLCCGGVAGAATAWVIFSAMDEPKKAQHACYIALVFPVLLFIFYFMVFMSLANASP